MDFKQAIFKRRSRRAYINEPLAQGIVDELQQAADECNEDSGLHVQMITNDRDPFRGLGKSYGIFSGVRNYFAMVGSTDDPDMEEKTGYYGERLLLKAVALGLGTCWIGGSYDRESCKCEIAEGEELKCVIAFGIVSPNESIKEAVMRKATHRNSKEIKDMLKTKKGERAPNWVVEGMRCVTAAPSSMNRQPVSFLYSDGAATAKVNGDREYDMVDLGIAKLHFAIGAGKGKWDFGNGGIFIYEEEI